jgi:hypothetical protein
VVALQNGQGQQAAAYFGEAILRLVGVSPEIVAGLRRTSLGRGVAGGARSGQRGLSGLRDARNLLEARLQVKDSTCGLYCAVDIIDDITPNRGPLNFAGVRSQIRANAKNGDLGLNSYEITRFIERNLENIGLEDVATGILRDVTEEELLKYLGRGDVMSLVDGNHWVRVLGSLEEGGHIFLRIYDPDRGIYEQLISSFMTRNAGRQMIYVIP